MYRAEWRVRTGDVAAAHAELDRAWALPGGATAPTNLGAALAVLDGRADEGIALLRKIAPPGTSDDALRAAIAQKLVYLGRADAARALAAR
jgi:hypothetical protein